jgi:hypothetical protein
MRSKGRNIFLLLLLLSLSPQKAPAGNLCLSRIATALGLSRVSRYLWNGETPTETLWKHTLNLSHFPPPPKGTKIEVVSYERLCPMGSCHFQGQRIESLVNSDFQLLKHADLDSSPHEVATTTLYFSDGTFTRSSPLHGTGGEIALSDEGIARSVLSEIQHRRDRAPSEIVFDHVHPMVQYLFEKEGRGTLRLSPLSEEDRQFGQSLSQQLQGLKVTVRAITPQGFAFSQSFLNGRVLPQF